MRDLIDRQAAIDALDKRFDSIPMEQTTEILLLRKDLRELPSAQPETDEWCTDCKEYDKKRHCCPRFNRVIRQTLSEQPEIIFCKDCANWDTTWTNDWDPNYHYCPMRVCKRFLFWWRRNLDRVVVC